MAKQDSSAAGPDIGKGGNGYLKLAILIALLALCIGLVYQQGWFRHLTIEHLALNREFLQDYIGRNFVFSILVYCLIYTAAVAFSFPGATPLTIAGGMLFGWVAGGAATVVSATIGAAIIFLVVKLIMTMLSNTSLGGTLSAKMGSNTQKLRDGFQKDALNYMLFLRLVPVFPFLLVNIAPAMLGVRLPVFFFGTLIGIIPGTLAFSYAGRALDATIDAQLGPYQKCLASGASDCTFAFSPKDILTWELIIAFIALAVISLIPVIIKKIRGNG